MSWIGKKFHVAEENVSLLLIIYLCFFTNGIINSTVGSLLPAISNTYALTYDFQGKMLSVYHFGNLLAMLLIGFIPFIIGRKRSIVFLVSGMIIGFILITITGNPLVLLISFMLFGMSRGGVSNIGNVTVTEISSKKTFSLNTLHATFALGSLLAPVLVLLVTYKTEAYWWVSSLGVALLGIFCVILLGRSSIPGKIPQAEKSEKKENFTFLTSFHYWVVTLILFFYMCSETSIAGWLVTYFEGSGKLSPVFAKMAPTILWVMVLIGRLLVASLSERMNRNRMLILMSGFKFLFFVLMILIENQVVVLISLAGLGFCMAGIFPTTLSTLLPEHSSSTLATGACLALSSVGAIIMPRIIGNIARTYGISFGVGTIFIPLLIVLGLTIVKYFYEGNTTKQINISK